MRTALIAALKRTDTGDLRAFQTLSGRSVIAWQYDLLRKLECDRLICLCEAATPEILEIQHLAEADGVQFHAIRGPLQLVGLITADQDLLMILDGLVIEPYLAQSFLSKGRVVATLPASSSQASEFPADFERIDATRAWAGLAVLRGSVVERLAELPADGDTMSLLLRLALQSGVKDMPLDIEAVNEGEWLLASDADELEKRQIALVARGAEVAPWTGPGRALAGLIVQKLAPKGLEQGPLLLAIVGIAASAAMVGASWVELSVFGLLLGAVGAFTLAMSRAGTRLRSSIFGTSKKEKSSRILNALQDILAVTALMIPALTPAIDPAEAALPVLAIGLARLSSTVNSTAIAGFWADRTTHLIAFAVCAIIGQLPLGIAVFAALALAQCILRFRAY